VSRISVRSNEARPSHLFTGVPASVRVWNRPRATFEAPGRFHTIGRTENAIAAVENPKKIYAVRVHRSNHTERGTDLLRNFLSMCKAEPSGAARPLSGDRRAIRERWE